MCWWINNLNLFIDSGGHPYLNGLAIAGGMYWIGWQGAIFGPLMLCFFIGIFEVATLAMRSNQQEPRYVWS